MRIKLVTTILLVQLFDASLLAESIQSQVQKEYPLTAVAADGSQVTNVGSVLKVKAANIYAGKVTFGNETKDGTVSHSGAMKILQKGSGLFGGRMGLPPDPSGTRPLNIGEKVYLVGVDFKESKKDVSSVVFAVQSCGTCDPSTPDPNHVPVKASISFSFSKGALGGSDLAPIQALIDKVFAIVPPAAAPAAAPDSNAPPSTATAQSNAPVAPIPPPPPPPDAQGQSATPVAPIPPPPPPADAQGQPAAPVAPIPPPPPVADAQPASVDIGQTPEQVEAILGKPDTILNGKGTKTYLYKAQKITVLFTNGKVSDTQVF
jgi:hypothetical protein